MPPKRKRGQSVTRTVNFRAEMPDDQVANVNRNGGRSQNNQNSRKTPTRAGEKKSETKKNSSKHTPPKRSRRDENQGDLEVATANFVEDGQMVDMSLSMGNDQAQLNDRESDNDSENYSSQTDQEVEEIAANNNAVVKQNTTPNYNDLGIQGRSTSTQKVDANFKEELIGETVARVKDVFMQSGFFEMANLLKQHFKEIADKEKNNKGKTLIDQFNNVNLDQDDSAQSEVTVYRNALINGTQDSDSNSGENAPN